MKGDLRKTARGASSPAKPALYISELMSSSACLILNPHHIVASRNIVLGFHFYFCARGETNDKAYPLSITNAATSSIGKMNDQRFRIASNQLQLKYLRPLREEEGRSLEPAYPPSLEIIECAKSREDQCG